MYCTFLSLTNSRNSGERDSDFKLPIFGAALGGLVGIVSGLILIWGYSLVKSTVFDKPGGSSALSEMKESETGQPSSGTPEPVLEQEKAVLAELA